MDGSPEGSTLHYEQSFALKTTSGFARGVSKPKDTHIHNITYIHTLTSYLAYPIHMNYGKLSYPDSPLDTTVYIRQHIILYRTCKVVSSSKKNLGDLHSILCPNAPCLDKDGRLKLCNRLRIFKCILSSTLIFWRCNIILERSPKTPFYWPS